MKRFLLIFTFLSFLTIQDIFSQSLGIYASHISTFQKAEPSRTFQSLNGLAIGFTFEKRLIKKYSILLELGYKTDGFDSYTDRWIPDAIHRTWFGMRKYSWDGGFYPFGIKIKRKIKVFVGMRSQYIFESDCNSVCSVIENSKIFIETQSNECDNYGKVSAGPSLKSYINLWNSPKFEIQAMVSGYYNVQISPTRYFTDGTQLNLGFRYVFKKWN